MCTVYPRVCGGTAARRSASLPIRGLSPRVRGHHHPARCRHSRSRSIPACAGAPSAPRHQRSEVRVYPRVCGGTSMLAGHTDTSAGLSPRVRGHLVDFITRAADDRSIPACAGAPSGLPSRPRGSRVYPRVCGGTDLFEHTPREGAGLSPRVRGHPFVDCYQAHRKGSIPACAGAPGMPSSARIVTAVYPRVCGGTLASLASRSFAHGLSPRVRGHLSRRSPVPSLGVYPRVCGGTGKWAALGAGVIGLSPRVRGHPKRAARSHVHLGSIPACAGAPMMRDFNAAVTQVYPRVCGGTGLAFAGLRSILGLSPRVRGHH